MIHQLIGGRKELVSTYDLDQKYNNTADNSTPVSFRLCMANVLISACQKLSDSRKKRFAREVLPRLVSFAKVTLLSGLIDFLCFHVHFFGILMRVSNVVGNKYTGRY